ncbi:hypothetical protein [Tolypothrix sp. VBCCA 56010]|uniref:hypothetical protein n=1 Tax=Tolypothrix sp. VBCCA 56010 TaxID=3137731 RepID=UPI003D7EC255
MAKHVSFRLPDDVLQAIDAEAEKTGEHRTTIAVRLFRAGLGLKPNEFSKPTNAALKLTISEMIAPLEQRIKELEHQLIK